MWNAQRGALTYVECSTGAIFNGAPNVLELGRLDNEGKP